MEKNVNENAAAVATTSGNKTMPKAKKISAPKGNKIAMENLASKAQKKAKVDNVPPKVEKHSVSHKNSQNEDSLESMAKKLASMVVSSNGKEVDKKMLSLGNKITNHFLKLDLLKQKAEVEKKLAALA